MGKRPLVVVSVLVVLCCFCGEPEKKSTVCDKLAAIAILEDARDMGGGEIFDYLNDPDAEVRARAAAALGRIQWLPAALHVANLLTDSIEAVRIEAAFALGQLGDSSGIFPIAANLQREESTEVKRAMIEALGKIGNPVVVSTLLGYLSDNDPSIRGAVALALARVPGHGRTSELIRLSRDPIADVRWKAVYAMARRADSTAFGRLRRCLNDSEPLVRQFAARAIGELGDSDGLSNLTDQLGREEDDLVKINIIRAISKVGDRKALKSLLNVLSGNHSVSVKAEGVAAIGNLRLDKAFAKLAPLLQDENRTIRCSAITAVAQIRPDFFMENLNGYLETADWYVKSSVIDGLREVGTAEAFEVAVKFLSESDPRLRRHALEAMLEFKDMNVRGHLAEALDDPDFTVIVTAIYAIASFRDSIFMERIADIYSGYVADKEPDLRLAAVEALSSWVDSASPSPTMLDVLDRAADDVDFHVRKAAIGALSKIGIDRSLSLGVFDTDITPGNYDDIFNRFASNPTAVIRTNKGDIRLELLYDIAPKTVNNFIDLAMSGYYDRRIWHRVIPGFVIQDGCPRGDGWGGPGYTIRCEYNQKPYTQGTLGMARSSDKDTGGSQFFITHTVLPHLDGRYTAFGRVTTGMGVVDRIEVGDSIRAIEIISYETTK